MRALLPQHRFLVGEVLLRALRLVAQLMDEVAAVVADGVLVVRFVSMSDASLRKNILSGFSNVLYCTLSVYATYLSAVLSCFSFIVTANGEIL